MASARLEWNDGYWEGFILDSAWNVLVSSKLTLEINVNLVYYWYDDYRMDNSSVVIRSKPIAQQVEEILRERIRQGAYTPDQRMPSEDRLAKELQVSRASLRTAMASLAAAGYISRRHGDGTYVRPRVLELNLCSTKAWDIACQIVESGRTPSLQNIEQSKRPAQPEEATRLELDAGEEILVIKRLFYADATPVALITTMLQAKNLTTVSADIAGVSPIDFLGYLQPKPHDGQVHFYAISADEETASLLQVEPGHSLLKMDGLIFDASGHPIILEDEIYLGQEGFQLHLDLSQP